MSAARTPGPWLTENEYDILAGPGGIARVATTNGMIGETEAAFNAAFIVEACNSHARLARERDEATARCARLEGALEVLIGFAMWADDHGAANVHPALRMARAALRGE